jgi:photosystem II stability/assembly factor-like uncharacterized protein
MTDEERKQQQREQPEEEELTQREAEKPEIDEDIEGKLRWLIERRAYPGETIPRGARRRALRQKRKMRLVEGKEEPEEAYRESAGEEPEEGNPGSSELAGDEGEIAAPPSPGVCNWTATGPRNINGRVRCLAIHPTNGNTVYAGAADGGVWRSTDAGQSWKPLMHDEDSLSIGSIAIDPTNPNIIYAGTGEPTGWPYYAGVGVLKSIDGGATWTTTGTMNNDHIARVVIDPTNTQIVYCAGFGPGGGLYKTTNGGTSWTLIRAGDITDVVLNPSATSTLYIGVRHDGVYKSTDSGATWTKLAGGLPAMASQRVMLTLCPASPLVLYAKLDQTVYKTTDGGSTWTNLGNHGGSTYGYWCTYIAVDPTDSNIVFSAGVSVERSLNGGTTWTSAMGGTDPEIDRLHADQHAMVFDPTNHNNIYAGGDGGVYRSTDGGNTWLKVSTGLIITQFYDIGVSAAVPSMFGGGTQDQGTNLTTAGLTWKKIFGWDGGYLLFHPTDPFTMWQESQNNNIRKTTDGGQTWTGATTGLTGSGPWIGAMILDPSNPNILFTGRQEIFRSTNGAASWSAVSLTVGGDVSTLAMAPSSSAVVYAGTSTGKVWKSTNGGTTWTEITTGTASGSATLPNRVVTRVTVDHGNAHIAYVCFSGFDSNTPATPGHVFRGTLVGSNWHWQDISGNLPDIPVNGLEIDRHDANTLYVASDVGVFRTTNLGTSWHDFSNALPSVPCVDIHLDAHDVLRVATHGRGMYQFRVGPGAPCPDVDIYFHDNELDTGEVFPSPSGQVYPLNGGRTVYWWQSVDIKVDAFPLYTPDALFDGVEFDRDLTHDDPVRGAVNRVYVQIHNRGAFTGHNVKVKLLYADATAGLPALPSDFWTQFPGDPTAASAWTVIHPASGTYHLVPTLEPHTPVMLRWDWTVPVSQATHSCLLAVMTCDEDPITATTLIVDNLVPNEKRAALKNLHVIAAPPGPFPWHRLEVIDLHNARLEPHFFDLVIDRELFSAFGEISVLLPEVKTKLPLRESLKGIRVEHGFGFAEMEELYGTRWDLPPDINPSTVYRVVDERQAEIRDILIGEGEKVRVALIAAPPANAKAGSVHHFSVFQRLGGRLVGGSTYALRVGERELQRPATRIRITLEKVRILDDHDPIFRGEGEFRFLTHMAVSGDPCRGRFTRLPSRGVYKLGERPGRNEQVINACIFDGFVGADDSLEVRIEGVEEDWPDADDHLQRYCREFTGPVEDWLGSYRPGDEPIDPEVMKDWLVWYRIEAIT